MAHAGLRHRQASEGSLLSSLSVWAPFPSLSSSQGKGACLVNSGQCTISSGCAPSFPHSSRVPQTHQLSSRSRGLSFSLAQSKSLENKEPATANGHYLSACER